MKALNIILSLILAFASTFMVAVAAEMPQAHLPLFGISVLASAFMPSGSLLTVINVAQLTFNGQEIRSLEEAIMEVIFQKPELNAIHKMVPGIVAKKQIALLGRLGTIGIKDPGCDPASSSNNIPLSEKFWDPTGVFNRDEQCYTDLEASFFVWGLENGVKKPDLTKTDFAKFLIDRTDDAVLEAIWRIAWFGDKDVADVGASPPGNLALAADVKFFDLIDGFWKQLFAITTTDPARRFTIVENALGTETLQLALASNRSFKLLQDLVGKADKRLKGHKNKVIYWTDTLNDNMLEFLESQNVNSSFERIEKGPGGKLSFRGIPIEVIDSWDRNIAGFFDNGVKLHKPHRAVLTVKDNIQLGIEDEASLTTLDPFYDKKTKKFFVDTLFKMDAKIIEDHLVQVAH